MYRIKFTRSCSCTKSLQRNGIIMYFFIHKSVEKHPDLVPLQMANSKRGKTAINSLNLKQQVQKLVYITVKDFTFALVYSGLSKVTKCI